MMRPPSTVMVMGADRALVGVGLGGHVPSLSGLLMSKAGGGRAGGRMVAPGTEDREQGQGHWHRVSSVVGGRRTLVLSAARGDAIAARQDEAGGALVKNRGVPRFLDGFTVVRPDFALAVRRRARRV